MASELIEKALGYGLKHVVWRIGTADLVASAAAANVNVAVLPAKAVVLSAWYDLVTVFTSGSITGLTCQVGVSADTDAYVTAGELLSGPPTAGRREIKGAWIDGDARTVLARFTATGGNLGNGTASNLTAGKVDIHVIYTVAKDA